MQYENQNPNFFIDLNKPETGMNFYIPISKNLIASLDSSPTPTPTPTPILIFYKNILTVI